MKRLFSYFLVFSIIILLGGCADKENPQKAAINPEKNSSTVQLTIQDSAQGKVRGQVLYVPIYSNVPYLDKKQFDLSAFLAIHNTDTTSPIRITQVLYYDNDGKLVKIFLPREMTLGPLAATNFYIPESDKSGTGANFIVEWLADAPVNAPLVESIMISVTGRGISFLSQGKVIRERK